MKSTMLDRIKLSPVARMRAEMPSATREDWLEQAVGLLAGLFEERGYAIPLVRVSCGWSSKNALKTMGTCWPRHASSGGINEIFISPMYSDGFNVLGTLVHELCHAVDDCASGHGAAFSRIARNMGLEGPLKSCGPGEWMTYECKLIEEALGPYPHQVMRPKQKPKRPAADWPRKFHCEECSFDFQVGKTSFEMIAGGEICCPNCQEGLQVDPR
jgi:hypothetical protein